MATIKNKKTVTITKVKKEVLVANIISIFVFFIAIYLFSLLIFFFNAIKNQDLQENVANFWITIFSLLIFCFLFLFVTRIVFTVYLFSFQKKFSLPLLKKIIIWGHLSFNNVYVFQILKVKESTYSKIPVDDYYPFFWTVKKAFLCFGQQIYRYALKNNIAALICYLSLIGLFTLLGYFYAMYLNLGFLWFVGLVSVWFFIKIVKRLWFIFRLKKLLFKSDDKRVINFINIAKWSYNSRVISKIIDFSLECKR